MKIGLLHDVLGRSRGGVEAWMYHVSEELLKNGHQVCAYTLEHKEIFANEMPAGVEIKRINRKLFTHIPGQPLSLSLSILTRELKKVVDDIDVFWARSYSMTFAATKVCNGRPVLYIQATPYPEYVQLSNANRSKKMFFMRLLLWKIRLKEIFYAERAAMCRSNALIYLSSTRRDEILQFYGESFKGKCHVVPSGVDVEVFKPLKKKGVDGHLKIISVCRLSIEKNLECVVRAIKVLKERGVIVEYTIVGEGPQRFNIISLIRELELEDSVTLVGRQDNVALYLREADSFVLPSTYEGFGTAYLEALACGLPCVALRGNPPAIKVASQEIIEHGKTGWLLLENSPELMANTLQKISENPEMLRTFSINARKSCEQRFTWFLVTKRLLEISSNF